MDAETLTALRESIAHWGRLASGDFPGENIGASRCPLCIAFHQMRTTRSGRAVRCTGCPVREFTGAECCGNTPYQDAEVAWDLFGSESDEFKAAARAELEFLRSLLPEGDPGRAKSELPPNAAMPGPGPSHD